MADTMHQAKIYRAAARVELALAAMHRAQPSNENAMDHWLLKLGEELVSPVLLLFVLLLI